MLYLLGDIVRIVAAKPGFAYDELEEKGIEDYMKQVKGNLLKYENHIKVGGKDTIWKKN